MNQKNKVVFGLCFIVFGIVSSSCGEEQTESPVYVIPKPDYTSVSINLPDSAGKEIFEANCKICHSEAYIHMQPDFPRQTWEKIVDKMQKNYGAPMDSASRITIIDYLVAIKGKK